ncbi:MAG TPA: hypothetical protein VHM02_09015, partial [Thermoanaerobaculia bacterium]|nr:hypothetical protein [Thermoanaerobaculia bacterium]
MSRLALPKLSLPRRRRRRGPAEVNLARRPFVNERPVRRAALLLLAGGLALAALNGWLYVSYFVQRGANAGELDRLEAQIEGEARRVTALSRELQTADLSQQNELVAFLNQRIAARSFGWSVLFDRLEEILPRDVRLISLAPTEIGAEEPRRAVRATAAGAREERRFDLSISAVARRPEAVLELLDALFADPAFRVPDLHQESFRSGEVAFTFNVIYLPAVAEALAGGGDAAAPA